MQTIGICSITLAHGVQWAHVHLARPITLREALKRAKIEHRLSFGYGIVFVNTNPIKIEHVDEPIPEDCQVIVFIERQRPGSRVTVESFDLDSL